MLYLIDLSKYDDNLTFEELFERENIKRYYYCKYNFKTKGGDTIKSYDNLNYDDWKIYSVLKDLGNTKVILNVVPQTEN